MNAAQQKLSPDAQEWYDTRPAHIQKVLDKYPPGYYRWRGTHMCQTVSFSDDGKSMRIRFDVNALQVDENICQSCLDGIGIVVPLTQLEFIRPAENWFAKDGDA